MLEQQLTLLNDLGFDISLKGAIYFTSITQQLMDAINMYNGSLDDLSENLPNNIENIYQFINCLYLEDYAFFYECGKFRYFKELNNFINSRRIVTKEQTMLNDKVFGNAYSKEELILNLCMYLNDEKKEENKVEKKDVKIFEKNLYE